MDFVSGPPNSLVPLATYYNSYYVVCLYSKAALILKRHFGNDDVHELRLKGALLGFLHLLVWGGAVCHTPDMYHTPIRCLGNVVGRAAVFPMGDGLLRKRLGSKAQAAFQASLTAGLSRIFPGGHRFGRRQDTALVALAGLPAANGMALVKIRARSLPSVSYLLAGLFY